MLHQSLLKLKERLVVLGVVIEKGLLLVLYEVIIIHFKFFAWNFEFLKCSRLTFKYIVNLQQDNFQVVALPFHLHSNSLCTKCLVQPLMHTRR